MIEPHGWWGPAYHPPRKHLMRVVRWCSPTVQTLSAGRVGDGPRTRGPFLHLMISFGPSLIFMQWLRTEVIISAIISAIIWGLSVANKLGDEMTGPVTPKQWDEDETRPRCSEMRALIDDATLSRWVSHPECIRRLPRLNGSKDGYIERPKFPHLVDRQREKFSLYLVN
jgi:hypothetical protein